MIQPQASILRWLKLLSGECIYVSYLTDVAVYIFDVALYIFKESRITLQLFAFTLVFSIPLGLIIALAKISRFRLLKFVMDIYIWLMRGTPLLLQLFFVFYGLPVLGVRLDRFAAAAVAFIFNYAAYFAEIFRAGIQSIDKGQYEGADVLGFTYAQTMRRIILPQVVKRVLPPVSNEVITLVKDTALVYVIGLGEVSRAAKTVAVRDFTMAPFFVAAVFYLAMTLVLTWIFRKLEKRFSYYE